MNLPIFWALVLPLKPQKKIDVTLEYRYTDFGEVATDFDSAGDRLQTKMDTNSLQVGVRFSF